ncbi:MAG: hypothetical protein MSH27_04305, partial [Desulfovibrio piger]|uniref:hypothetical protein n=1 Tax=Desulfovibrio piger TaxID=901 RepID=UPI0026F00D04
MARCFFISVTPLTVVLCCCFFVLGIAKIFFYKLKKGFIFRGKSRIPLFYVAKRKAFSAAIYGNIPDGILSEGIIHQTYAETADIRMQQHLDDLIVAVGGKEAFEICRFGHPHTDPVQVMLYGKEVIDRLDEAVVIKVGEADAFPVIQGILGPYVDAGLMLRDLDEFDVLVGKDMREAFRECPAYILLY